MCTLRFLEDRMGGQESVALHDTALAGARGGGGGGIYTADFYLFFIYSAFILTSLILTDSNAKGGRGL